MDIRVRKMIARITPLHQLCRVALYNSGAFYYKKKYRQDNYAEFFDNIHDSKRGKRCFIIGNGPSLIPEDLDRLKDEDCFAANSIFRVYPKTVWRPTYYVVMDRYWEEAPETVRDIECGHMFLGDYYCRFNKVLREDFTMLHEHFGLSRKRCGFSEEISKYVVCESTVSLISMQIAAYMGYSEVYLLGLDHNYRYEIYNGVVKETEVKKAHAYEDDVAPQKIIADVAGMTRAYGAFRDYARAHGITVKNATRGGKLEVFERVDFDSLFEGNSRAE